MDFEALLKKTSTIRNVQHVVFALRDVWRKHPTWGEFFKAKIQVVLDQNSRPEWTQVSGL